ncbi:MAG: high frequency lysogenization protein HflD, partial [Campylobacterota bacterium]|nr:high frequency lysogenization protein HflD [Campylobacterota bacterium]
LFCIMLKHFVLGIVAAVFMSIGMGLTISLAGILTVLFRKKATMLIESKGVYFEIFGACMIIVLGLFLFSINVTA